MKIIKKIKGIRAALKKRPRLDLMLKIISVLYSSSVLFSVVMIAFIVDILSSLVDTTFFNEFTLMTMILLTMEFFTSILISQYIGQYLVNINKVSMDTTGEKKMEESAIIKSVVYFQVVFLLPGIVIISIGSILLAILWIILLIIIIKLIVFISISVTWLLAL